jgi:hypothetical protein
MLCFAGALILLWFDWKPGHPLFGMLVAMWTCLLGPGMAIPVMLRLPRRWFRVPAGERVFHRILGVGLFGWLLARSGYNRRLIHPQWGFSINRAGLPFRALAARGGASAHGASFVIHIVLAGVAHFTGYPWGAVWILLPGVVLHLYPVLLQRAILLRLQPLLRNSGATERTMRSRDLPASCSGTPDLQSSGPVFTALILIGSNRHPTRFLRTMP